MEKKKLQKIAFPRLNLLRRETRSVRPCRARTYCMLAEPAIACVTLLAPLNKQVRVSHKGSCFTIGFPLLCTSCDQESGFKKELNYFTSLALTCATQSIQTNISKHHVNNLGSPVA